MNRIRHILTIGLMVAISLQGFGKTTREELASDPNKTGGVYFAYPVKESHNTPAPEGYQPFYISHYGRHGSRYLISTEDYTRLRDIFQNASSDALTELGNNVKQRIDSVMLEADGRGGDLSPLGVRQHRAIAERMFQAYPEVFKDSIKISARSTLVVRCVLSMDAFCERLKELNPTLQITRESSQKYMPYLCYGSPESGQRREELGIELLAFKEKKTRPERLMASLFKDEKYVTSHIDPSELMWGLYYLASDMQNMETPISFYDIFTDEELFDLWQVFNFDFYVGSANYAGNGGLMIENARNLLNNIIDSADEAIKGEQPSATFRFGHDGNLIPLAGILQFPSAIGKTGNSDEAFEYFADFKVAPMAGNVQMIFFRNPEDVDAPILVKLMLNEEEQRIPVATDMWPFYEWDHVKRYYDNRL